VQAGLLAGTDGDILTRDLYHSIEKGNFPKWKMFVQIMPEAEGYKDYKTFDVTKIWSHKDFPLIEVGEFQLNRNPTYHFGEVEQVAFSPSNVIPGIGYSPDPVLQGRLIAYQDAQRYRIGVNFEQLPINCPHAAKVQNQMVHGRMHLRIDNKFPHYSPSSFGEPLPNKAYSKGPIKVHGDGGHFVYGKGDDEDFYKQPGDLFRLMSEPEKERLTDNIAVSLETVPDIIANRMLQHFHKCDPKYGQMVESNLKARKSGKVPRTEAELVKMRVLEILKNNNPHETIVDVKDPSELAQLKKHPIYSSEGSDPVPSNP